MPTVSQWLIAATKTLASHDIPSARLDAELILSHTLRKSRTYLHANGDKSLEPRHYEIAETRLLLRTDRTPIAYLIGHKEFYGRLFKVTPATLIPRPESEEMIELLKATIKTTPASLFKESPKRLVDVGTGTGCLGITAKLELPSLDVTLVDISKHALNIARSNASRLHADDLTFIQSDLLEEYPFAADYILANLPYVASSWQVSPEVRHEPELAVFAKDGGLQLIKKLIQQTSTHLAPAGHLYLEADPRQHEEIIDFAKDYQLNKPVIHGFIIHLQKA